MDLLIKNLNLPTSQPIKLFIYPDGSTRVSQKLQGGGWYSTQAVPVPGEDILDANQPNE